MNCPECGTQVYDDGATTTLVGYVNARFSDERGVHNHDDNCIKHYGHCVNRHKLSWRNQNTCPVCEWRGKEQCFCHPLGVRVYDSSGATLIREVPGTVAA